MQLHNTFIPYGGYWSSPFVRWQGSLAREHPLHLAAKTGQEALRRREIPLDAFDALHLGSTIPAQHGFYGAPWLAGLMGAEGLTGPTVSQACATSVRLLRGVALEVETGLRACVLAVAADRTSNGPHLVYPEPSAPGGTAVAENWVWDNFHNDPHSRMSMIETAEAVAAERGYSTARQHEIVLQRHGQYQEALLHEGAFQKRYMVTPLELNGGRRKVTIDGDEGIYATTAEGLAGLAPVVEGGTVTYGGQTHPADGNAGMVLASWERARELATADVEVQVLSFGEARAGVGRMPEAPVPAAREALDGAGLTPRDVDAFKLHDPFAVGDLVFCEEMGIAPERVNRYGSSLIWGHPQAPTGLRSLIELIEELHLRGGGVGLFSGCSAGDSAAAVAVRVDDESGPPHGASLRHGLSDVRGHP